MTERPSTPRASSLFLLLGAVASVTYLLLSGHAVAQGVVFVGLNAAAMLAVAVAFARHRRTDPLLWTLLLAGVVLYTLAAVPWFFSPATGNPLPFPSLVDVTFYASYVVYALFLVRLVSRYTGTGARGWLDSIIVAGGVSAPLWEFVLRPTVDTSQPLVAAALLAYPGFVLVLLCLALRLLLVARVRHTSTTLVIAWMGGELVSDTWLAIAFANGTFSLGSPWFLGWFVSYACLGAAVLHGGAARFAVEQPAREPRPRNRMLLLGAALLIPLATSAIVAASPAYDTPGYSLVTSAVLVVLVLIRLEGSMTDLNEQRRVGEELARLTESLRHAAFHDPLTGLANRALLNDRVTNALAQRATAADHGAGVLLLDLDTFKYVNDTLGHDSGDRVLVAVAGRLRDIARSGDTIARVGGDEFAILLPDVSLADAVGIADRLVQALRAPVDLGVRAVAPTASVGVVVGTAGEDRQELLKQADIAMYAAKGNGRDGFQVFNSDLHQSVLDQHALLSELRGATGRGELFLEYQPVVDLSSTSMTGVEALVRWRHPQRGVIPPFRFIPLAESSGTIREIGEWVLREACLQVLRWDAEHPGTALHMAVNLSPRQLEDRDLILRVTSVVRDVGIAPQRLVLEVTETGLGGDTEAMIQQLQQLKSLGVVLAIDDFGTGYSSLSFLRRLPVDILKIDKSFVDGIAREPEEWALATAIVKLATSLGKQTLAEGIELGEQLAHLRALRCELGQGYLFDRPLGAAGISARLAEASAERAR